MLVEISDIALRAMATRHGLSLYLVTNLSALEAEKSRLLAWQGRGYAAELSYMLRSPDIFSDIRRILPSATSVMSFIHYYDRRLRPALPAGYGKVARYAWGRDYHKVLKRRLEGFVSSLRSEIGADFEARVFSDAVPILERAWASRGGAGFIGKNTMLIQPGSRGSFSFISEIVSSLRIRETLPKVEQGQGAGCGSCQRCMDLCPTKAFVSERVLDAGKCISYLTIEKRTELSWEERQAIGEWIFGCDECQEVCPFNHTAKKRDRGPEVAELGFEYGVGPHVDLASVLSIRTENEFVQRFQGTALMRATRQGLLRNAAVVAANSNSEKTIPALTSAIEEDSSPLVRSHALWALVTMSRRHSCGSAQAKSILDKARGDPFPLVRNEAEKLQTCWNSID